MKKKLIFLLVCTLVISASLVGCKKAESPSETGSTGDATGKYSDVKVGLVLAGGLGDRSFYDSSNEGLEQAKEAYNVLNRHNAASKYKSQADKMLEQIEKELQKS